jgi:hypothetical protein
MKISCHQNIFSQTVLVFHMLQISFAFSLRNLRISENAKIICRENVTTKIFVLPLTAHY